MADICRGSCLTQENLQIGALACAFPGQQRPYPVSCTQARRKGWWLSFPLLAAVGLLLASDRWLLGYNIEVSSAEKGVYVPAGILKPQRSYEQKRTGRRRVAFEDELQQDDSDTQGHTGVESGRRPSSAVRFQETKLQDRGGEGQVLQKQGALRRQSGSTQGAATYSNLESHSADVHEHGDHSGVYERQSSESSNAAQANTTHGELEDDGAKREQGRSSRAAGGSGASVKQGKDRMKQFKEATEKAMRSGDYFRKVAAAAFDRVRKAYGKGSHQHVEEQQAGETEAR